MKKRTLKKNIKMAFYDEEAVYAHWVEALGYASENGYDPTDCVQSEYPMLDCGDESIANCYLAMEQVFLLIAEKEGLIPAFSHLIDEDKECVSADNARLLEEYPLHRAAFNAAMDKYGFEINPKFNWEKGNPADKLEPDFAKHILHKDRHDKEADALWEKIVSGEINPDELEELLLYDSFEEGIMSITSPKGLDLQRRFYALPKCRRRHLEERIRHIKCLLKSISEPMGVYEGLCTETDTVTLETGEEINLWYPAAYAEDYSGYSNGNVVGTCEMAGPTTIFLMEEVAALLPAFEKELVKVEKKTRKAFHERAVKGAKARWKKYRLMFT